MKFYYLIIAATLLILAGCSPTQKTTNRFYTPKNWDKPIVKEEKIKLMPSESVPQPTEQITGYASWYGPGFHGKKTANGETYNQNDMTAAHKFLPLDSWVAVTNLENNKTIKVRINDRGPYKKNRIIDLTKEGATRLGFMEQGTAKVSLKVLKLPDDFDREKGYTPYKQVVVQLGVFNAKDGASRLKMNLQKRYQKISFLVDHQKSGKFHVIAGPYQKRSEAKEIANRLKRDGVNNFVRSYRK